ncbi:hypothetical protein CDIK_0146 [Cucumispora dikerogammari]|nr:hypothetical protein CDIK_0146 [Cucumispora dikerogammari]
MIPIKYYIKVPLPFLITLLNNMSYMFFQTCFETLDFLTTLSPHNLYKLEYEKYLTAATILICLYLDMSWLYRLLKLQSMFDAGTLLGFLSTLIPLAKEVTNDCKTSLKTEKTNYSRLILIVPTIFFNVLYVSLFYTQYFLIHETIVEAELEKTFISFFKSQFAQLSKTIGSPGSEEGLGALLDDDINNGFDTFLFLFISFLSNVSESNVFKMTPLGPYFISGSLKLLFDVLRHVFYMKRNKLDVSIYGDYEFNMERNNMVPKIVFLLDSLVCYAIKRKMPFQGIARRF